MISLSERYGPNGRGNDQFKARCFYDIFVRVRWFFCFWSKESHVDKVYRLLFAVAGLVLTAGCGPGYRYSWVGPGTEQDIAQVRYQCGGDHLVVGPGELGRIGTGRPGEPDPSLFTEYQAKKTPLALSHYRRHLFIKCMESKGYKLEPHLTVPIAAWGRIER